MSGKTQASCVLILIILLAFSICALADAHEVVAPDGSQGETALRYLDSQTYDDPQAIMPGELADAFAAAILNGLTAEADREMERLAATDLPAKDQEDIAQTLLELNIAVPERSKPLAEFCDVRVSSAFYALLNDQKTPEDKLRVEVIS